MEEPGLSVREIEDYILSNRCGLPVCVDINMMAILAQVRYIQLRIMSDKPPKITKKRFVIDISHGYSTSWSKTNCVDHRRYQYQYNPSSDPKFVLP
jgi:hypothetical protein